MHRATPVKNGIERLGHTNMVLLGVYNSDSSPWGMIPRVSGTTT